MAAFKIALRSLLKRKVRMALIGLLVLAGSFLMTFGGTFAQSTKVESQRAIIENFTGDLVLYNATSKDMPSPFSFTSLLPVVPDQEKILSWLRSHPEVESAVALAQNIATFTLEKGGKTYDLPLIFYAVDPQSYLKTFENLTVTKGTWFEDAAGTFQGGISVSENQVKSYLDKYGAVVEPGDSIKLLSVSGGGAVNAVPSTVRSIFQPIHFSNVYNYINFMDIGTYSQLFNFTGIDGSSLPTGVQEAFSASSEEDIFALQGQDSFAGFDTDNLKAQAVTGYSSISVKLRDHSKLASFIKDLEAQKFPIKYAKWDQASGFFASVADVLQGVVMGITILIFLVVVLILMNTFIINILERTGEIGTLRAIGAEKGFVSSIFLWESFMLNLAASGLGAALAFFLALGLGQLQLPEIMSQYLVGGGPLILHLSVGPFLTGLILVTLVAVLATLYPTRLASKISPLKAMSTH